MVRTTDFKFVNQGSIPCLGVFLYPYHSHNHPNCKEVVQANCKIQNTESNSSYIMFLAFTAILPIKASLIPSSISMPLPLRRSMNLLRLIVLLFDAFPEIKVFKLERYLLRNTVIFASYSELSTVYSPITDLSIDLTILLLFSFRSSQ